MNPFAAMALAVAKSTAIAILKSIAQAAYDKAWDEIYVAVEKAEDTWKGFGASEIKKEFVLNEIVKQIKAVRKLTPKQERRLRMFASWWIDQFVTMLNKRFEQTWRQQVESLRKALGPTIPFVD